jgi:hypothetical protein
LNCTDELFSVMLPVVWYVFICTKVGAAVDVPLVPLPALLPLLPLPVLPLVLVDAAPPPPPPPQPLASQTIINKPSDTRIRAAPANLRTRL